MDPRLYTAATLLAEEGRRSPEEWLQLGTLILTRAVEAIGAIIIASGVIRAVLSWIRQQLPGRDRGVDTESIRLGLGRSLSLALEFLLAADILSTAVAPSWEAIGKLAAVAAIRTALNYFLERELVREEQRQQGAGSSTREVRREEAVDDRVTVRHTIT